MALPPNSAAELSNESTQHIASQLPEAQTLPDGFSESYPETSASVAPDFSERSRNLPSESSVLLDESTGLLEVSTIELMRSPSASFVKSLPDLGFQSPQQSLNRGLKFSSESPERNVGYSPTMLDRSVDYTPEMTDFSVELNGNMATSVSLNKSTVKTRRFPVPLSEGDCSVTTDSPLTAPRNGLKGPLFFELEDNNKQGKDNRLEHDGDGESAMDSDGDDCELASSSVASHLMSASLQQSSSVNDGPLQDILESKIASPWTGHSKVDDEEAKLVKCQLKELSAMLEGTMLDGTEQSSDEKLRLLDSKYLQQVAENRQLEKELLGVRRKCEQVNKEKDTICGELTKVSTLRQKLESLCRELQRQNKILIDDNKRVALDEQQRCQELSSKFHNTITDITIKLEEEGEARLQQIKENEMLREKLKLFTQKYEIREQHFGHQLRTKVLEQQLTDMKLKQQEELHAQEEAKTRIYTDQISQLLKTEQDLRSQLALYGDKFEQFQDTLTKSNEVFATFKKEMEKMSKTIKQLEKENLSLKKKCEKSDVTIIELLDERALLKKQVETSKNQKEKLEAVCRSLQAERKSSSAGTVPLAATLQDISVSLLQREA